MSKLQAPPLYPFDMMVYEIGEMWSVNRFDFWGKDFVSGIDSKPYIMIDEIKN